MLPLPFAKILTTEPLAQFAASVVDDIVCVTLCHTSASALDLLRNPENKEKGWPIATACLRSPLGTTHTKNKITAVTVAGVPFQLQLDDLTWGLQLTPTGHRGA